LGEAQISRWQALQETSRELDNAFLHPVFARAVGEVRPQTRVAVFDLDGSQAFLAFEKKRAGLATALASGWADAQAVMVPPDTAFPLQSMLRSAGIRLWAFDHLVLEQTTLLSEAPGRFEKSSAPIIDLSKGYDGYVAEQGRISKTLFSLNGRRRRQVERDLGPLEFSWHEADHGLLDTALAWKSVQYRRSGVPQLEDEARLMIHHLLDTQADGCRGWLSSLRAGGTLLAVHMGLRSRTALSYWHPAYDPTYSKYSPGLILLLEMAQRAAADGLNRIELGRGEESYKARVGSPGNAVLHGFAAADAVSAASYPALMASKERAVRFIVQSPRRHAIARSAARGARNVESLLRSAR
jgi:CelD/BcsL family acetyltransferase involved in cellulose biosynthesis